MSQKQTSSYGWVVTFSGTAINLALGALYAWSVFKGPLQAAPYNLTASQAALPYSVCCAIFAVAMVLAGRMQDKIGPRIVATIGGVLVGGGFLLSGFALKGGAINLNLLVIGFGILAGTGIGLGYAAATPPAIKWFPARMKGLIVGIVVGGFGLASVYVAPLTNYLVKAHNISYTFVALGIGFCVSLVLFSQLLKNPPAGYNPNIVTQAGGQKATVPPIAVDYSTGEMLRTPQFYLMWIMYAFGAGAGLMIISFLAGVAKANLGFWAVAILAVGNASGRVITGTVSDKLGRKTTLFIILVLHAIILVLFDPLTKTAALVAVGAFIAGYTYGSYLSLFPSITADYYGLKNLGLNYGVVFTAWGAGGLILPQIAGRIMDATGSYGTAYYIAAGLCAVAALLTFALKPPKERVPAA